LAFIDQVVEAAHGEQAQSGQSLNFTTSSKPNMSLIKDSCAVPRYTEVIEISHVRYWCGSAYRDNDQHQKHERDNEPTGIHFSAAAQHMLME
jgi:hypothetical protein